MSSEGQNKPNWLFCVGAQKAGTTWLYDYFSKHPHVHVPPVKELHYFNALWDQRQKGFAEMRWRTLQNAESQLLQGARDLAGGSGTLPGDVASIDTLRDLVAMHETPGDDHQAYRRFMQQGAEGAGCIADITPDYSVMNGACFRRMHEAFPNAKFLFILRDPVARAWSHLKMHKKWMEAHNQVATSEDELLRMVVSGRQAHIMERSAYHDIVTALCENVPRDRIEFLFYETMFSDEAMAKLCDFMEVPFHPGDYGKKVRKGESRPIAVDQRDALRRLMVPVYRGMAARFGTDLPESWDLEALKSPPLLPDRSRRNVEHLSPTSPIQNGRGVFYGIGTGQSGISPMHRYLDAHAQVYMPRVNENEFFATVGSFSEHEKVAQRIRQMSLVLEEDIRPPKLKQEMRFPFVGDLAVLIAVLAGRLPYNALFEARETRHKAFGELSESNALLDVSGYQRMLETNPEAKFFCILRDPMERFVEEVRRLAERRAVPEGANEQFRGLFKMSLATANSPQRRMMDCATTITRLEAAVPADQILYLFHEDLYSKDSARGHAAWRKLTDFLEIDFVAPAFGNEAESTVAGRGFVPGQNMIAAAAEVMRPVYDGMRAKFGAAIPPEWNGCGRAVQEGLSQRQEGTLG